MGDTNHDAASLGSHLDRSRAPHAKLRTNAALGAPYSTRVNSHVSSLFAAERLHRSWDTDEWQCAESLSSFHNNPGSTCFCCNAHTNFVVDRRASSVEVERRRGRFCVFLWTHQLLAVARRTWAFYRQLYTGLESTEGGERLDCTLVLR